MDKFCEHCKGLMPNNVRKHAKYCSDKCRWAFRQAVSTDKIAARRQALAQDDPLFWLKHNKGKAVADRFVASCWRHRDKISKIIGWKP